MVTDKVFDENSENLLRNLSSRFDILCTVIFDT